MKSRLQPQKGGKKIDHHFWSFYEPELSQDTPSDEPCWTELAEVTDQTSSRGGREYDTPLFLQEPSLHRLLENPFKEHNGKNI